MNRHCYTAYIYKGDDFVNQKTDSNVFAVEKWAENYCKDNSGCRWWSEETTDDYIEKEDDEDDEDDI